MPVEYSIDGARSRLEIRATGAVTLADFAGLRERLLADPAYHTAMDQLFDLRRADLAALSTDEVRRLATSAITEPIRRAWVVDGDLAFGLVRMYESLAADRSGDIQVFRDLRAAEDWLDRKGPG